jgi:hypothetical protein
VAYYCVREAGGGPHKVEHQWNLFGLDCPLCGPWSTAGREYPSVDLLGSSFASAD